MPAQYPRDIVYLSDEQIEKIVEGVAAKAPVEQIAQRVLELLSGQVPVALADADKEDIADLVLEKMKAAMDEMADHAEADDSADEVDDTKSETHIAPETDPA